MAKEQDDVRTYYDKIRSTPIGEIVHEEMPGRITAEDAAVVYVDCPNHASTSRRSLHAYKHENRWRCWGCGVGGDIIHLLEFIRAGVVTQHKSGVMPETHRDARDELARRIGIPPLGRGAEDAEGASGYRLERAMLAALTDLSYYYHEELLRRPEAVAWCKAQWGFDVDALRRHVVGYAPAKGQWSALLATGNEPAAIGATGMFSFDASDNPIPTFRDRIFFPYFSRGVVVYGIGRRTPWSGSGPFEKPKYRKMRVHHPDHASVISRAIDNRVLWGEDILATRPRLLLITEGVTDAIAAQEAGFACVSPVTVRLAGKDLERVVDRCRASGVDTVCIVQDNEISGVGTGAAMDVAAALEEHGIRCLVGTIPLTDEQRAAHAAHAAMLGDSAAAVAEAEPNKRAKLVEEILGGDADKIAQARALADRAKADLCSYFRDGGTAAGLEAVLAEARAPIEIAVDEVPVVDGNDQETVRGAADILRRIGMLRPATQEAVLHRLKARTGVGLTTLRREAKAAAKASIEEAKAADTKAAAKRARAVLEGQESAPRDTAEGFHGLVDAAKRVAELEKQPCDWGAVAEAVHRWIEDAGGRFYRGSSGAPVLLWEGRIYDMRSDAPGPRSLYEGLMWRLGAVSPTTAGERRLFSVLAGLAADRGELYHPLPWIHTDTAEDAPGMSILQGFGGKVLRVTADGVEAVENGGGGLILRADPRYYPWDYAEADDAGYGEGGEAPGWLADSLRDLIADNLACHPHVAGVMVDWLTSVLLIGHAGTRPMLRIEGDPSCGKSFFLKLATTLLYGHEAQKHGTTASNWSDASRNPICPLDNVETVNATADMIQFLLLCVTGIVREKRAAGTESETILEQPMCLVVTSGVEPLGGGLSEVSSRSISVRFSRKHAKSGPMVETRITARIAKARSLLLSALVRRTSRVLALMRDHDGHRRAMMAVRDAYGEGRPDDRARCDEFLALMWMGRVADMEEGAARDAALDKVSPDYAYALATIDREARRTLVDSSPITAGIEALFGLLANDAEFRVESGLGFTPNLAEEPRVALLAGVTSTRLYTAVREAAKRRGIACPYDNAVQFGRRLSIHIPHLQERGFSLTSRTIRGSKAWDIRLEAPSDDPDVADFEGLLELHGGGAGSVQF